jgi:hypothetical protein
MKYSDTIAEIWAEQPVCLGCCEVPRGAIRHLRLEPDGTYTVFLREFQGEPFPPNVHVTGQWCRVVEELRHSFPCYRLTAAGLELLSPPPNLDPPPRRR